MNKYFPIVSNSQQARLGVPNLKLTNINAVQHLDIPTQNFLKIPENSHKRLFRVVELHETKMR